MMTTRHDTSQGIGSVDACPPTTRVCPLLRFFSFLLWVRLDKLHSASSLNALQPWWSAGPIWVNWVSTRRLNLCFVFSDKNLIISRVETTNFWAVQIELLQQVGWSKSRLCNMQSLQLKEIYWNFYIGWSLKGGYRKFFLFFHKSR